MSLLDFLFPKRCVGCKEMGAYVCPTCFASISFFDSMVCVMCQKQTLDGLTHPICKRPYAIDGVFSSLVYKGIVKKMVYTFKYPPYVTDLESLLTALFYEGLIQKEQCYRLLQKPTLFVPVPLSKKRYRTRGYNQSLLLAAQIAKYFNGEVGDILVRVRDTKTQIGLTKEERTHNIRGAFALKSSMQRDLKEQQIFLVDDVATSGATLRECAKVLKSRGAKSVWGITLAHGE